VMETAGLVSVGARKVPRRGRAGDARLCRFPIDDTPWRKLVECRKKKSRLAIAGSYSPTGQGGKRRESGISGGRP